MSCGVDIFVDDHIVCNAWIGEVLWIEGHGLFERVLVLSQYALCGPGWWLPTLAYCPLSGRGGHAVDVGIVDSEASLTRTMA